MARILMTMAHPNPLQLPLRSSSSSCSNSSCQVLVVESQLTRRRQHTTTWDSVQRHLKSDGRIFCLFSSDNNNRNSSKDLAKKALESALGGKKTEFEKWDKEIKKREELGGGGDGGGGWWRRWFGGSDGEHFWHEAQLVSLTLLVLAAMFLILAKGDVLFAAVLNPLLFALRSPRNGLRYISSKIRRKLYPSTAAKSDNVPKQELYARTSAKESVVSKWAS